MASSATAKEGGHWNQRVIQMEGTEHFKCVGRIIASSQTYLGQPPPPPHTRRFLEGELM